MNTINTPAYIEPHDFSAYCKGPMTAVAQLLSLKFGPNSQKLKQMGARALGYSCYEALVARWRRKDAIINGFYVERCSTQQGRLTIKSKNIVIVYDETERCFIGMALRPGEEARLLTVELSEYDDVALLYVPDDIVLHDDDFKNINIEGHPASLTVEEKLNDTFRAVLPYFDRAQNKTQPCGITLLRTHEGIIMDLYDCHDDQTPCEDVIGSFGLMFTDRQESENGPDCVNLYDREPQYTGTGGCYYRWMKTGSDHEGNDRLLPIDPDEEFDISDLHFESKEKAIDAIESGDWSHTPESMREIGAVLVNVSFNIVSSPY